ncbi:metallophosphoesterase [Candidatus Woesearchaeota archaeon]|nr:MAG: metallophosphoesterase [Candidatus Woesearchaeota archaeon]
MNRILQIIIFLIVFLSVYFILNYYTFFRILGLFEIKKTYMVYSIFISLSLSYIISSILVRTFHNFFTRSLYTLSSVYMGVLIFAFSTLLIYEIINLFYKSDPKIAGIIILVIVLFVSLYSIINSLKTEIVEVELENFGKGTKIVQLSDVHVGTMKNSKYLTELVAKVNNLKPDIVLITGDLVDGSGPLYYESYQPLEKLNAKTFFIHGNHETYEGLLEVENIIKKLNITLLKNEVVEYRGVQIAGIEFTERKDLVKSSIENLNVSDIKPSVLMTHVPLGYEEASKKGFNLMLSGHTHNGQIYPFNLLVRIAFKHIKGAYDIGEMMHYVSPGTSTWGPPMRLGSKNEITVFNTI